MRVASIGECMLELALGTTPSAPARFGFGGDTLNTAVYLARALAGRQATVSYVTALGDDPFSTEMIAAWEAEGVDTGAVARIADALPGLYLIRTDAAGERAFYYWRESAAARRMLDDGRDLALAERLRDYDLVYLSGITLGVLHDERRRKLMRLLESLAGSGTRVAFDTNFRPRLWPDPELARRAWRTVAAVAATALPSLDDERALFGDASTAAVADRWLGWGVAEVVVKDGPRPCLVADAGGRTAVAPEPVRDVVDTTAAGDSFNGGYLAARLLGAAPAVAAAEGHRVAARVIGARGAIVPRDATDS
ncbi:MAG: sugar kinase [Chromatiales bacterium]|nr:sugar kinase [Chromatiales bacterium]